MGKFTVSWTKVYYFSFHINPLVLTGNKKPHMLPTLRISKTSTTNLELGQQDIEAT